jgi:hypothetical protein
MGGITDHAPFGASPGEVAEWSIALDLKSSEAKASEGSNPSLSV